MGTSLQFIEALETRRLLAADLDYSFGATGRARIDFGAGTIIHATALQNDGKIVIGGAVGRDAFVARVNADGSLDHSFGLGGMTRINLADGDVISDLKILPGGKIVAAGTVGPLVLFLDGKQLLFDEQRSRS